MYGLVVSVTGVCVNPVWATALKSDGGDAGVSVGRT